MVWFWNQYLGDAGDGNSPLASPLRATTLAGLPPAIVITAEFDPARRRSANGARRMTSPSVVRYDSQIHGFFGNAMIDDGISALDRLSDARRQTATDRAPLRDRSPGLIRMPRRSRGAARLPTARVGLP